jgi:hypothetical protein
MSALFLRGCEAINTRTITGMIAVVVGTIAIAIGR